MISVNMLHVISCVFVCTWDVDSVRVAVFMCVAVWVCCVTLLKL